MPTDIHEREDWPQFRWDQARIADQLASVSRHQGFLVGRMDALGLKLRAEAVLETLTTEVIKSSEIEGEVLDRNQVRSSLARRLGIDAAGLEPADRDVEGVVEMMLDATQGFAAPLTSERLFSWHAALFPTGRSGLTKIVVGAWRTEASGAMQVVSGPIGRERVHYEAPTFDRLDAEMAAYLTWFNAAPDGRDPVIKAALAHLWFVTIHPFDDGNGRIARAICDMALARSENRPRRFYSMSSQIRLERRAYYDVLQAAQKGDLDVTEWLGWFLTCLDRAFDGAAGVLEDVMRKARFWEAAKDQALSERQRQVLNRLLDGFEGMLTSSTWAKLTRSSQDTASRDIKDLLERGLLVREPGGGRSTSYALADPASVKSEAWASAPNVRGQP